MKTGKKPRWKSFKESIATESLPEIGPTSRPDRLSIEELDERLDSLLPNREIPRSLHRPLRAAALLWHDHLDASHAISQEIHNADGSLLHGIMHRREPDYANAKYWFHRVGKH